MTLDFDTCYRAVLARDPRFDGRFFTAVTSTGIYCRPVCPARTPARRNIRFYPHAGAAEAAGFRACRRCRPETSPGSPEWNIRADLTGRAVRLIADGYVDEHGVDGLARRLAVTERHLRRLLVAELGAGPLALARTHAAADRAAAAGGDRDADHRDRVRERVLQRPPVQRDASPRPTASRRPSLRPALRAGTARRQGRA